MSNKISSCRHELQQNFTKTPVGERAWRGRRRNGRGFTILPNAHVDENDKGLARVVRWSLATLRSHAHNETGLVAMSHLEFAECIGGSVSTAKRHIGRLEETYYVRVMPQVDPRTGGWTRNLIKVYTPAEREEILKVVENKIKFDPTPRVINEPSVLINTSSSQYFKTPPTPQRGESVCKNESKPEIQRPTPSSEVYESEIHFRDLRRRRKFESRSARHREAREEKHDRVRCTGEVLTAFQRAALEVMSLCGVAADRWRIRDGIAAAMLLEVGVDGSPVRCVENMALAWKDYLDERALLFRVGIERFFAEGLWRDVKLWTFDRDKAWRY